VKKTFLLVTVLISYLLLSGCSAVSIATTSQRLEETRESNKGKQLLPNDGQTYFITISPETANYLGSGNTDFRINNESFTQPKGTNSVILVSPGTYSVYAKRNLVGGGEASDSIKIEKGESICFTVMQRYTEKPKIEYYKNDQCTPALGLSRRQNIINKIN
jgi:hypothetical protein